MAGVVMPVAVLPTAFNSGVNLLYLLGSLLLAYMLCAVVFGLWNMSGVRGEVVGPLTIDESQPPRIQVRWTNTGRARAYDLRLRPAFPRRKEAPEARLASLAPGESDTAYTQGPPLARGVYDMSRFLVESPFPIGFMRTQRRFTEARPRELVVMPRLLQVDFTEAFGTDQTLEGEDIFVHGTKGGANYYGVRPYLPGDPLKAIHWKATARRYYLFLDMDESQRVGEGSESNLEYLVRLAASLGRHLSRGGALYHFVWFDKGQDRVRVSPAYGSSTDLDAARSLLASIGSHRESRLTDMLGEAVQALTPGNRLVFFVPKDPATVPDDAAGAGFPAKAIFLVQAGPAPEEAGPEPETGLAARVDLYRYSIEEDHLSHERR
jgi:uncharacterized protein (DUF58 family)